MRTCSRTLVALAALSGLCANGLYAQVARDSTTAPKPDYSAPAGAPYTAIDVTVPTPMGHTLAGTLTLPRGATAAQRVGAVVTITGSGPQEREMKR